MFTIPCLEHRPATTPDADARVNVHSVQGTATTAMWDFTIEPYAHQRSSGAPPG